MTASKVKEIKSIEDLVRHELSNSALHSSLSYLLDTYVYPSREQCKTDNLGVTDQFWNEQYKARLETVKKSLQGFDGKENGWIVSLTFDHFTLRLLQAQKQEHTSFYKGSASEFVKKVINDVFNVVDLSRDIRPSTKGILGISDFDPKEKRKAVFKHSF